MIKICNESITITLKTIFEESLKHGVFEVENEQMWFLYIKEKIKI